MNESKVSIIFWLSYWIEIKNSPWQSVTNRNDVFYFLQGSNHWCVCWICMHQMEQMDKTGIQKIFCFFGGFFGQIQCARWNVRLKTCKLKGFNLVDLNLLSDIQTLNNFKKLKLSLQNQEVKQTVSVAADHWLSVSQILSFYLV